MKTVQDESQAIAVDRIKTHPELQPRALSLLKVRERTRQELQSEAHIRDMAHLLKADPSAQLHPVELADVEGTLYVVDGHHRLAATKRAKRPTIPARVKAMTLREAHTASKLANIQGTKLEMQAEQKRNALWHYLAAVTNRGTLPLPKGDTQRTLAGRFGIARDTLQRMLARLSEVDPSTFPEEHLDTIAGWPHWRWVRGSVRNDLYQQMTPDMRQDWQADKYAKALRKLWERYDSAVVARAHRKMMAEGVGGDGEPETAHDADRIHATAYDTSGDF